MREAFSEIELDALTELVNIGVSSAATSLSRMVRQEVGLSVPAVALVTPREAAILMRQNRAHELVAVQQEFSGDLSGRALLLFMEESSFELARLLAGDEDLEPEVRSDALREAGNIILQGCLSAIANLLRRSLSIGSPHVVGGSAESLLGGAEDAVLFVYMNFEVRERRIGGYVALVLGVSGLEDLRTLVAEFITTSSG